MFLVRAYARRSTTQRILRDRWREGNRVRRGKKEKKGMSPPGGVFQAVANSEGRNRNAGFGRRTLGRLLGKKREPLFSRKEKKRESKGRIARKKDVTRSSGYVGGRRGDWGTTCDGKEKRRKMAVMKEKHSKYLNEEKTLHLLRGKKKGE